jgi:hypothetical protein
LDQGGELFNHPGIRKVLTEFEYEIYPTGANSSHQNGFVEHSHGHIGDALCAKLTGANLNARFWPYGFVDYIRKHNAICPAPGQSKSSLKMLTLVKKTSRIFALLAATSGFILPESAKVNFNFALKKASSLATCFTL